MRRPDLLGAALRLTAAGRPVFPCRPSDKAPLVERGFLAATRSEAIVHGWWVRWPGALIGMPTGIASGVVALDLDVKHGRDGAAAFDRLRAGRAMPAHPVVRTRSGGVHRYFAAPEGRPLPCSHAAPAGSAPAWTSGATADTSSCRRVRATASRPQQRRLLSPTGF